MTTLSSVRRPGIALPMAVQPCVPVRLPWKQAVLPRRPHHVTSTRAGPSGHLLGCAWKLGLSQPCQTFLLTVCVGASAARSASSRTVRTRCRATSRPLYAFEIRSLEGKGKGVIAKKGLHKGELILEEVPLLVLTREELGAFTDADIEERLRTLPQRDQTSFWELFDAQIFEGTGRGSAKSRVLTNSYPVEDELGQEAVAVFNTIARFNHSCVPNVHNSWDAETGAETIRVIKDIQAGEELCTTYLDLFKCRQERQQELSKRLKFQCTCEAQSHEPLCNSVAGSLRSLS